METGKGSGRQRQDQVDRNSQVDELTIQISVLFALLVCWQKRTDMLLAGSQLPGQIPICFITFSFVGLASCQLSQSELVGTSEQVFHE